MDKEIKLRARAEGLAVKKFFNYGQVGRGFSLDIPFHRTLIEDQQAKPACAVRSFFVSHCVLETTSVPSCHPIQNDGLK